MITIPQKKFAFACLLGVLISICLLLSQCKSPAPDVEGQSTAKVDSTAVDTTVAAPVATPDTVVKKATRTPLTLIIKNLRSTSASVVVGLYGTKNKFPDPKDQLKEYHFTPHGDVLTATITDQKFDDYAIAIYQDVNGNGKIDKNMIGIPTEPYAFSKNYIPRIKAPNFNDCRFSYNDSSNVVTMTLSK